MLTLIVGGAFSGKYGRLIELGYAPGDIGAGFEYDAVYKLNDVIRKLTADGAQPLPYILEQLERLERLGRPRRRGIACDEVGGGIVPLCQAERDYREAVGRACCLIAKKADTVERMVCGIPQKLK